MTLERAVVMVLAALTGAFLYTAGWANGYEHATALEPVTCEVVDTVRIHRTILVPPPK